MAGIGPSFEGNNGRFFRGIFPGEVCERRESQLSDLCNPSASVLIKNRFKAAATKFSLLTLARPSANDAIENQNIRTGFFLVNSLVKHQMEAHCGSFELPASLGSVSKNKTSKVCVPLCFVSFDFFSPVKMWLQRTKPNTFHCEMILKKFKTN